MELSKSDLYDSIKTNYNLQQQENFANQSIYNRKNEIRELMEQEHKLLAKKSFQNLEINERRELKNIQERLKAIEIEMQIVRRNTP